MIFIKKNLIKLPFRIDQLFVIILLAVSLGAGTGCANKKNLTKPVKETSENEQLISKAKSDLLRIINDEGSATIRENEQLLNDIIALNLDDPEVNELIAQAQDAIKREKDRAERQQQATEIKNDAKKSKAENNMIMLKDHFDMIANATSDSEADQLIASVLRLFESPNVPVLIVIYEDENVTDYDEPTTIQRYLEYLKDQDKSLYEIKDATFDSEAIITELELIKK